MTGPEAKIYNVHDAKTHLSKLLEQAENGEDVVIARAGRPVVRLAAIERPVRRKPGILKGYDVPDSFFDPIPDDILETFDT